MSLKEQLAVDLKESMKDKNKIAKSTITLVRAAILQVEKDEKRELSHDEIIDIVSKQVKQRRDALGDFQKAGRQDLIDQTQEEIAVLTKYLPEQLSEDELKVIVLSAIDEVDASSMKDMGKIMGKVMPKIKGRADGKMVSKIVKENL